MNCNQFDADCQNAAADSRPSQNHSLITNLSRSHLLTFCSITWNTQERSLRRGRVSLNSNTFYYAYLQQF